MRQDLLSLLALGVPAAGQRYISEASDVDLDSVAIDTDWLLMTRSGTIGRVFYLPKRFNG